jgi:hypothetical protein
MIANCIELVDVALVCERRVESFLKLQVEYVETKPKDRISLAICNCQTRCELPGTRELFTTIATHYPGLTQTDNLTT